MPDKSTAPKQTQLAKILNEKGLSQSDFIRLIKAKTGCTYGKSNISHHVTGKYEYMSTDTLMVFAFTLNVKADDILDWPEGLIR